MKKRALEIQLQRLDGFSAPKPFLEQYLTPARIAADILFTAYSLGDLHGKIIADLGAGTGIFSIGACILGAKSVYAVEIDEDAVKILNSNIKKNGCENHIKVYPVCVSEFDVKVNTVIQNPPFGSQRKHADLPFLEKSVEVGNVVYTLHNAETTEFVKNFFENAGWKITLEKYYDFPIPHLFRFHREEIVHRKVVFFRAEKNC